MSSECLLLKSAQSVVFLLRLFLSWIKINEVSLSVVSLHEASCLLNLIAQPCWKDFGLLSKKGPFVENDLISQSVFGIIWKVILHYFQSVVALGSIWQRRLSYPRLLRWFSFLASQVAVFPITLMSVEVSFAGCCPALGSPFLWLTSDSSLAPRFIELSRLCQDPANCQHRGKWLYCNIITTEVAITTEIYIIIALDWRKLAVEIREIFSHYQCNHCHVLN